MTADVAELGKFGKLMKGVIRNKMWVLLAKVESSLKANEAVNKMLAMIS